MMNSIATFAAAVVTMGILDGVWIGVVMSDFYKTQLGAFLRMGPEGKLQPILWAAGLIYILIPMGIVAFVLPKVNEDSIISSSLMWGFLFGIVVYGTYDFTNYSLVKEWPILATLVDVTWGGVICALVSMAAALVQYKSNL